MTAGHPDAFLINLHLARACQRMGWPMGVGSQRRQLIQQETSSSSDSYSSVPRQTTLNEWEQIRETAPDVIFFSNIGLAQAIQTPTENILPLIECLSAKALIVHLNPLQECLQPEGNPQFKGGLARLQKLANELPVPLIVKETGCGFSKKTLQKLIHSGVRVVDISGLGGTHWGRIEGARSSARSMHRQAADTFQNWGVSTVASLQEAQKLTHRDFQLWASGGVRSGLDAAKLIALGAERLGIAQPLLSCASQGVAETIHFMHTIEFELKIALFCSGCQNLQQLKEQGICTQTM